MNFIKKIYQFLKDVAHDERIPQKDKAILLALIALIISPFDFIPDWIPFFGLLDDFVMAAIILDYFFTVLDSNVLLSHFPWEMKYFIWMKRASQFTSFVVPRFLKKKIWSYTGSPYA
jgi:uncharacterized membrane protein YkvA (DUF1232 family)